MSDPEIYCPKCGWVPGAAALWSCLPVCGAWWNTFATGGVCPECGERFEHTQCLSCAQFSPHAEWYHPPREDRASGVRASRRAPRNKAGA